MLKKVDFENSSLQNEQTTSTDNIKFGDSIFKNPNNTAVSKPVSHNFFNPFKNNFDNDIEDIKALFGNTAQKGHLNLES